MYDTVTHPNDVDRRPIQCCITKRCAKISRRSSKVYHDILPYSAGIMPLDEHVVVLNYSVCCFKLCGESW